MLICWDFDFKSLLQEKLFHLLTCKKVFEKCLSTKQSKQKMNFRALSHEKLLIIIMNSTLVYQQ